MMYSHIPATLEQLDLLVKEINDLLSKVEQAPLARVEEFGRGTNSWNWSFLWESKLKVADVRMYADDRGVRINFLYLGETKDMRSWVNLLMHSNQPGWNQVIDFLGSLGHTEFWKTKMHELQGRLTQAAA